MGQMWFDRDGEGSSFLGEVISIMRPTAIHLDIKHPDNDHKIIWPTGKTVRLHFEGGVPGGEDDWMICCTVFGRSYGECLYEVRKEIRRKTGR